MDFLIWITIVVLVLLILAGIKDGIKGFFFLWSENGLVVALYMVFLIVFIIVRVLIRDYEPKYIGVANLFLMLYVASPIVYRLFKKGWNSTE